MGKKDKTAKAAQKAQKQVKQAKKAAKGEKKQKTKVQDADSDEDTMDVDAVLAAYAEEQARFLKVTENKCDPPSPRSSSTIIASPSLRNELFVFAGEYLDPTGLVRFYNDLFVYNTVKGEWSIVTSPNSPPPRSGHAWTRSGNTGKIYCFGGEFSSPKQGVFYHFNSMYMLDPDSREWSVIEPRGKSKGPPARSGHRMTYWKNFVIVFGGFQDTSQQTRYLNDLWVYDCKENVWHEMKLAPASQRPEPRSSCTMLPHESGAVLYGGYSRVRATTTGTKSGKGGPQRNVLQPMVHQDTWFLRLSQPPESSPSGSPPIMRWERRKRPANAPNPPRAGATMAYHKGRGILFGGVHDVEESDEGIDSEFFNAAFIWNVDRNRFYPVTLRRPKAGGKKQVQPARGKNRGKADEEELLRNLAALETKGSVTGAEDVEMDLDTLPVDVEIDVTKDMPVKFEMPHPRFNAQLAVQDDTLFVFGGTYEKKDTEITFSDLYSIDLGKLDGVKELYYIEPVNWNLTTEESEDEDDADSEMDTDGEDEDEDGLEDVSMDTPSSTTISAPVPEPEPEPETEEPQQPAHLDPRPFPRAFETLRAFYARTSTDWQTFILQNNPSIAAASDLKDLRKKAFETAEARWWDCREEVLALEDEQEDEGRGEVVDLGERGNEGGGGAGRRR